MFVPGLIERKRDGGTLTAAANPTRVAVELPLLPENQP